MTETLRQVIHDHMAQGAALHAAGLYRHLDGDTAAQLFALLTDTALAYLMEVEADLADPAPASPWPPPPTSPRRAPCWPGSRRTWT